MAHREARRTLRPIQLRADDRAQIPNRDLHAARDRALCRARHIHGRPAERERGRRVDAGGAEEHADVGDGGVVVVGGLGGDALGDRLGDVEAVVREQDDVADYGEGGGGHGEGGARLEALGGECDDQG